MNVRLNYTDRQYIEAHYQTMPVAKIAKSLGRDESTIYRELQRGGSPYYAEAAQEHADRMKVTQERLRMERERQRVERIKEYLIEEPTLTIMDLKELMGVSRPLVSSSYQIAIRELYQESKDMEQED